MEIDLMIPTCGAKSKGSGKPCQRYPCKNGRCHLHGGRSTGPKTRAGRERQVKAVTKYGRHSKQAIEERKQIRKIIKDAKDLISQIH